MWLMKMSYRWFLFQCQPPVPWGFLFYKYEVRCTKYEKNHVRRFCNFMRMKTILILIFLLFMIAGCGKTATEQDKIYPVVTISSPASGQVFTAGQSIPITASITDETYIAEVHVHVSNTNTGELLMDVHNYPAGKTGTISQSITAAAGVHYKIQVIAKDRAVNETNSTVLVSCN